MYWYVKKLNLQERRDFISHPVKFENQSQFLGPSLEIVDGWQPWESVSHIIEVTGIVCYNNKSPLMCEFSKKMFGALHCPSLNC